MAEKVKREATSELVEWIEPIIRTFHSVSELKNEAPHLYYVLEARGLIAEGRFFACSKEERDL